MGLFFKRSGRDSYHASSSNSTKFSLASFFAAFFKRALRFPFIFLLLDRGLFGGSFALLAMLEEGPQALSRSATSFPRRSSAYNLTPAA